MGQGELISAGEAARRLRVKRATLYTYVSRGWLTRWPGARGESRYLAAEVEDLKRRSAAHRGQGPAASEALRWGPPVLSSAITSIDADGPNYRLEPALWLAERRRPFECVAELLWTGALPARRPRWPDPWAIPDLPAGPLIARLTAMVAGWGLIYSEYGLDQEDELQQARALIRSLALAAGGPGETVAEALAGGRVGAVAAIEAALVLCADHELNASTFAARVAASTGASLLACVGVALGTFSGPLHGGAPAQVARLFDAAEARGAEAAVAAWAARREALPGTGHPLYPEGDPRGAMLLALAREAPGQSPAFALAEVLEAEGAPRPNLDFGMLALTRGHGLPDEAATAIFAVGRAAGWVAHVREQREQPGLLRPRARAVEG